MTTDQIIELAKQAGFQVDDFDDGIWLAYQSEIQRFAELVRNEVLEDAAKYCEGRFSDGAADIADGLREMKK